MQINQRRFLCKLFAICVALSLIVIWGDGLVNITAATSINSQISAPNQLDDDYLSRGTKALNQGKASVAIEIWEEGLKVYEQEDNHAQKIDIICHLAEAYQSLGHHPVALEYFEKGLGLAQKINDQRRVAIVMGGLGQIYSLIGNKEEAIRYLDTGLAMAREHQWPEIATSILNTIGNELLAEQAFDKAFSSFTESIELAKQTGNLEQEVRATINASRVCISQNNFAKAQFFLQLAFSQAFKLLDYRGKTFCFIAIGELFAKMSDNIPSPEHGRILRYSFDSLKAAEQVAELIDDHVAKSLTFGALGHLYEQQQRYDEALFYTTKAVFAAQQTATRENLYRWQWQVGRIYKVKGQLDRAISAYQQAEYSLRTIREDLATECKSVRLSFRDAVEPVYFGLADLLLKRSKLNHDKKQQQKDLLAARTIVEKLKAEELQDYYQDECVIALTAKSMELDQVAANTAIIYPVILPDRLELIINLTDGLHQVTVPVEAHVLTEEVRRFRQKLERPLSRYRRHAQSLYNWLVKPYAELLVQRNIDTLIFVPDGPLRTVPMAALWDGDNFLINSYSTVITPGLNLTDPKPLNRHNTQVLISGITEAVQGFSALNNVKNELNEVQKMYSSLLLQDKDFAIPKLEQAFKSTPYSIVHIASHGQFDSDPAKTFILTYDGKLYINKLESLMSLSKFRKEPVELLTLSACQTAAGDDRAALGLAGVAIKAGARSALATLWSVDDAAASRIIQDFYRQLQDPSVSKAQAIQHAQVDLINNPKFSHPAYWAPFLLIGNWL